jgi:hypothetical protein
MFRNKSNYWHCSKFADFVRGEKKPFALTLEDWKKWKEEQKSKRPIRFYLSDTVLKKLQNILYFPRDLFLNFKSYIDNRYVDKMHCLKTGLTPGSYYDLDTRILHGLFNELKDFVEIELARNYQVFHKKEKTKLRRSEEDGISYLNWSISLLDEKGKPTAQSDSAKEILELYNWWKSYPNRPDPMEESGWSDLCKESNTSLLSKSNKDLEQKKSDCLRKLRELEEKQEKEEEDMLIKLIKVRKSLWT